MFSGLPPATDIRQRGCDVGSVQQATFAQSLLNHLICGDEQARRHSQAERLRCLEVDGRFVPGRRLNRKVGGIGAAQDAVDIKRRLPPHVDLVDPVGYETTSRDELTERVDRRQAMAGR